jgi:hypothetical protein
MIASWDPSTVGSRSVEERQQLLAVRFQELMTAGSSLKEVNNYRKLFFDDVRDKAKGVGLCVFLFTL